MKKTIMTSAIASLFLLFVVSAAQAQGWVICRRKVPM